MQMLAKVWQAEKAYRKRREDRWFKNGIKLFNWNRLEQLFIEQEGRCKICDRKLHRNCAVDHDHKTGAVRSLLCSKCNLEVGHIENGLINGSLVIYYLT